MSKRERQSAILYDRDRLVELLIYHQRRDARHCTCGWGRLGASHAEHIADVYERTHVRAA